MVLEIGTTALGFAVILAGGGLALLLGGTGIGLAYWLSGLARGRAERDQADLWEWRARFVEARNRYQLENPDAPRETLRLPLPSEWEELYRLRRQRRGG